MESTSVITKWRTYEINSALSCRSPCFFRPPLPKTLLMGDPAPLKQKSLKPRKLPTPTRLSSSFATGTKRLSESAVQQFRAENVNESLLNELFCRTPRSSTLTNRID